jgi:anthranilate phosphoribosyltransferase
MSISQYLKEIGRGREGARSLTSAQALDLMTQILDGEVSDLELGGFALAMRMKGESVDELIGFLDAAQQHCIPLPSERKVVVLPSYNGARRLPNLTPLLAMRLAQEGAAVLVHGPMIDPKRVTTAEIFHDLGLPIVRDAADLDAAWTRHEPAFMPIDALCPPLALLLEVRWTVGVRNSGHTVAKMLNPMRGTRALRVMNYTHPEFGELMASYAQKSAADVMLLRGTEGEPVADPRRLPRMEVCLGGQSRAALSCSAQEGVLTEMPLLPRTHDAATTALYVQGVVSGEKPAPAPLERQVSLLLRALAEIDGVAGAELTA